MKSDSHEKPDVGGIRPIVARWIITAEMVLKSAAHLGGKGESAVDMAVLRDPKDGVPLLPGASIAGALRSHLADVLCGYYSDEDGAVAELFGGTRGREDGDQSPLIVFDSLGRLPKVWVNGEMKDRSVEIRDGVAIEPKTGVAEANKKFDIEVLPAGTIFPVRLELIVADSIKEHRLIELLTKALEGLAEGDICLGARRARGLGAVSARKWRAVRYDLKSQAGWLGWLSSDALSPISDDVENHDSPWGACIASQPGITRQGIEDKRRRMVINAELTLTSGLLVRSPASGADTPDAVQLTSAGSSVLPGTSLAGVLRNRALRIARIVRNGKNDAEDWVNRLFGPRPEGGARSDDKLEASRLRISESVIENGTRMRPTRIRIDRFTQGVYSGALFDEEPEYCGRTQVRLELRKPRDGDCGLLLLLLKDLLSGDLHVGGAGSVGRGVVKGTARLQFPDGREATIESDLKISNDAKALFNEMITAFHRDSPDQEMKEVRHEPA